MKKFWAIFILIYFAFLSVGLSEDNDKLIPYYTESSEIDKGYQIDYDKLAQIIEFAAELEKSDTLREYAFKLYFILARHYEIENHRSFLLWPLPKPAAAFIGMYDNKYAKHYPSMVFHATTGYFKPLAAFYLSDKEEYFKSRTKRSIPNEYSGTKDALLYSAENASFLGRSKLAVEYIKGKNFEKNYKKAFDLLELCLKENLPQRQKIWEDLKDIDLGVHQSWIRTEKSAFSAIYNNLGVFYFNGIDGVERNENLAFELFKKAAESLPSPTILANLSLCYKRGIGTEKDESKARQILKKNLQNFPSEKIDELLNIEEPKFFLDKIGYVIIH